MSLRLLTLGAILVLLAVTGCDRYVDSLDPIRSLPEEPNIPEAVELTLVEATESYEIYLTWTQSTASDFTGYRIYRANADTVSETSELITTITNPAQIGFVDTTVAPSTTYFYRVFVRNAVGESAGSNALSATTSANATPTTVILAGVIENTADVVLTWTRNSDDDFASYRIYRGTSSADATNVDGALVRIITNQSTTTETHSFSAANPWYRIYVYDRQGAFIGSDPIQVSN